MAILTLCAVVPRPCAAGQAQARASAHVQRTAVDSRLAIVPFAVPVAVPVATVQQPLLLYSYRQYALAVAQPVTPDEPRPEAGTVEQPGAAGAKILAERCVQCHSGAAVKGNVALFDAEGRLFSRLPRQKVLEMVEPDAAGKQRMPPGEVRKLSPEEVQAIRDWSRPPRDAVY